MVKQYIGARYVPKFDGDYNSEKEYEPLTIVTYMFNSYTSKKIVPPGILPTNEEYWACTGLYNQQVEEYRQQVVSYKEETDEELDLLNDKVDNINKTFALVFGNSYAAGVGSETNKGIYDRIKDTFTDSKLYYGSGTGFLAYESGHLADTFIAQLNTAILDESVDNNEVTHIVVLGAWGESREMASLGYDDFITQLLDAVYAFKNTAKSAFPNLKEISYAWCEGRNFFSQSMYGINNYFADAYKVHRAMSYVCNRRGVRYLGYVSWNINFKSGFFSADNYHPNDYGYESISNAWLAAYVGEFIPTRYELPVTEVASDNFIPGCTFGVSMSLTPDHCLVRINHISTNGVSSTYTVPDPDTYAKCPIFSKLREVVSNAWYPPIVSGNMAKAATVLSGPSDGPLSIYRVRGYSDSSGSGIEIRCTTGLTGVKSTTQSIISLNIECEAILL